MSRLSREVEFEFRGDGQGKGEFLASGKVVGVLAAHVARGELEQAASLLASCSSDVGDDLIRELTAGGCSSKTLAALADMFQVAKDFARAARCAEMAGRPEVAARLLEANYELDKAAEYYLQAGDNAKAAEMLERNLEFDRAADLYLRMRDFPRAAECLERAGRHYEAGQIYIKMSRWDKAVEALQKEDRTSGRFPQAVLLLGQVLERTGNDEMAMQRYVEVVRSRPIDAETLEIHCRLARLCARRGMIQHAQRLADGILCFSPGHSGVQEVLALLGSVASPCAAGERTTAPTRATSVPSATATPATASAAIHVAASGEASPRPLDLGLGQAGESPQPEKVVGVDREFEFLRRVPLFRELSLDDLKHVQSLCEKVRHPAGARLIAQGTPGEALHVIARGRATVTVRSTDGTERAIGEIGPGAHVGEMSLLDDTPTSASVVALDDVNAYRLARQRFHDLLQSSERIQVRIYRVLVETLLARLRETNAKMASLSVAQAPCTPVPEASACRSCAEPIEAEARHCPHCGAPVAA